MRNWNSKEDNETVDACGGEENISHVLSDSLLYDTGQDLWLQDCLTQAHKLFL